MTLSIVTPWHNCPELLGQYEAAVAGADQVVIVDNGSDERTVAELVRFAARNPAVTIVRNARNRWFAAACNQGLAAATGAIVMCLNNDVMAQAGWLEQVRADVRDDGLYGPACDTRTATGQPMTYLDGWCIAARRSTWEALGGWDAETFPMYWSDVDLSFRAHRAGYPLRVRRWAVVHLSNYTSQRTAGAYTDSAAARARFARRVAEAR